MKVSVVITDANILIDLISIDLSGVLFESDVFVFKTSFFVFDELYEEQKEVLLTLVNAEKLEICVPDETDLFEIYSLRQQTNNVLSMADCSVWYFAFKYEGVLLTGDKQLRVQSSQAGIEVRGILFLFDQMLIYDLLTYAEAIEKLQKLYEINKRLPKNEIDKRIKSWRKE